MTDRQPPDYRWVDADGTMIDEADRGLVYDLHTLLDRRRLLGLFGGIGAAGLLAACSTGSSVGTSGVAGTGASGSATGSATSSADPSGSSSGAGSGSASDGNGPLTEVPDETAGPFPGDGSNGVDVLDDSGIVRADIRSSFGTSSTVAQGVPLTVRLTVRDVATGDVLGGAGVYVWHCDRDGNYSLYSPAAVRENYLRGVQRVDDAGTASFTTIFPGCYSGRWPHIHFEVYRDLADAVGSGPIVKTSQLALPKETCESVYAGTGYESSLGNLAGLSLAADNVFGDDGGIHQLASMSGDAGGYTAALTIAV